MHTQGIEERTDSEGNPMWFIRSECCGCHWRVGVDADQARTGPLIDRLMWTDEAAHRLERLPPYVRPLVKDEAEAYARGNQRRVVTYDLLMEARRGVAVEWDEAAARRLDNVPGPVRAMARIELERTAVERGLNRVTVQLMEEVKARYFGMAAQKGEAGGID
ncbi:hypothetical protein YTPLAS18_26530 [Nitrospira sp.]|nr:hypothetical protein YTPLAS18_26530 [Nitrospira sp.]